MRSVWLLLPALSLACATTAPATPTPAESVSAQRPSIQSEDILAREPVTDEASVKHVLIAWRELKGSLGDRMDPRAAERSRDEAEVLAQELLTRIRAGEEIEPLMAEFSEDPGSAETGRAYEVTREAPLAFMFKRLGLRLQPGEAGIAKTNFGFHVIQRVE